MSAERLCMFLAECDNSSYFQLSFDCAHKRIKVHERCCKEDLSSSLEQN